MTTKSNFHWYVYNDGTKAQMYELLPVVMELFENGRRLKIEEIANEINMCEATVVMVVRKLCAEERLGRQQTNRHTIYFKKSSCLLAEMLYPKSIIDKFKVVGRETFKADDSPVISYPQSTPHQYSQISTVYDGGE